MIFPPIDTQSLRVDCTMAEIYTMKSQCDREGNLNLWPADDQILLQIYCQDGIILIVKYSY